MNWFLLLICLIGVINCQTPIPQNNEKGFIDWINHLLGGSTTSTTTLRPTEDPPQNCPQCRCGIARTKRRIVGGYETKIKQYIWMVVLMYNGRFYCGGTLINDLYILTAAHCTAGFRKERITVRFMEHDRSIANETKTMDRKISEIIRHLRYNPGNYDNDIALLKLAKRVDLSSAVKRIRSGDNSTDTDDEDKDDGLRPVCLPEKGLSYTNQTAVVTGWGTTEEGGSVSNVLQQVQVPIISNEECLKGYPNRITDNMLCAGWPEGGRDACQGDSGGPLHIMDNSTEQFYEAGVVSWGEGCARPDRPGVYTRVNRYLTWLQSNTRDACYCS